MTIQTDLGTVSQLVRSYQVKASLSEPALSLSYLCQLLFLLFFGHVSLVWWKGLAYFGDATGIAFTSGASGRVICPHWLERSPKGLQNTHQLHSSVGNGVGLRCLTGQSEGRTFS